MGEDEQKPEPDRVSLAGLDPEEALRALLKVDPDSEPAKPDEDGEHREGPPQAPRRR